MKNPPRIVMNFPQLETDNNRDANPAIQLFGRRFSYDQTEIEYLVEFLLVIASKKSIEHDLFSGASEDEWQCFPDREKLKYWPANEPMYYYPDMKLMLKLFAFLGSSDLETRHISHRNQFDDLLSELQPRIETTILEDKEIILSTVEKVLAGFMGIGGSRTWCAHSFLPIATELLAGETIWEKSSGKRDFDWKEIWEKKMFLFNSHRFLARGGEVLFLQLCNLFRMADDPKVEEFEKKIGHEPGTAIELYLDIEKRIKRMYQTGSAKALNALSRWIESASDSETIRESSEKSARCGWCPEESWKEAYLFAWEMNNILAAILDPIEKIEMLKLCCVFQTLRSLCAQSARYWEGLTDEIKSNGGTLGYAWIVTESEVKDRALKESAKSNLIRIQEMIHGAIRTREIQQLGTKNNKYLSYKEGDKQAQELFVKLGKKIEFIAPYNGPGARFVMTDTLLRYFVLALIPPGKRTTLTTFQERLYQHYGIAISGQPLNRAIQWTHVGQKIHEDTLVQHGLEQTLRAIGFLIPLSDDVSMVENPFKEDKDPLE